MFSFFNRVKENLDVTRLALRLILEFRSGRGGVAGMLSSTDDASLHGVLKQVHYMSLLNKNISSCFYIYDDLSKDKRSVVFSCLLDIVNGASNIIDVKNIVIFLLIVYVNCKEVRLIFKDDFNRLLANLYVSGALIKCAESDESQFDSQLVDILLNNFSSFDDQLKPTIALAIFDLLFENKENSVFYELSLDASEKVSLKYLNRFSIEAVPFLPHGHIRLVNQVKHCKYADDSRLTVADRRERRIRLESLANPLFNARKKRSDSVGENEDEDHDGLKHLEKRMKHTQ